MPQKKKKRKPRSRARGGAAPARAPQETSEESPAQADKRRERLEARREAKAKALVQQQRRDRMRRLTRIVVLVGTAAFIIWFLFLRNAIPDAIAGHEVESYDPFISESRTGTLHTDQPVTYESDPPVSGSHAARPVNCGVYAEQVPNENMVHTLEHGAVGILYNPEASPDEIEQIEALVQSYDSHVISAPYAELDPQYAITSWAYTMPLESYDEAAVKEFVDVFRQGGDAPEANQECPTSVNNSFTESQTATPTPSVSPAPDKTEKEKKNN